MPIYEYQCTECGLEMEKLQKLSDEPLTVCPECGKPTLQKKVSAAGFRLKGSGWYETDFKSKDRKNVAKGDSKSKTGGDSSGKSSSGDSK
ncbi:putative FmdB family regulatory protein [Thiogranum longum]|uniref:Putative FmdB family regulatory protein n=1 Tax=Thiogranum longum TaxID=1537524 RepID=A0A4R1H6H8_9GAMM|nr:zinc ribbon domain-containing protein [Thiogranum longum]TCK17357.1 putative FmdB family regulatory protein [Thiogranum longum]